MDNTRRELLRELAKTSSLQRQRELVQALAQLDKEATLKAEEERSLNWAEATIKPRMEPRIAHSMHTEQTDWLEEINTTASSEDYHNKIHAEASMWFNRVDEDVKADPSEFAEQARGIARRVTGGLGDRAEAAAQEFLSYVAFLHRQAASGLPQVQQEFDAQDQYSPTPMPPEAFPTFEGPIHPINEWVENGSTTDSNRPSRAQDVGGATSHSLPDETDPKPSQGYPTSGGGTGATSEHDTQDNHSSTPNQNWPDTTPSGDAAGESATPSEHDTDDELKDKVAGLSLWDSLEVEAMLPLGDETIRTRPEPNIYGPHGDGQSATPPVLEDASQERQDAVERIKGKSIEELKSMKPGPGAA